MTDQELEDALMTYLAHDEAREAGFQSLTAIFLQLPESSQLTDEQYDDDEVEDKERVRAALDKLVQEKRIQAQWGERDYEASYRLAQNAGADRRPSGRVLTPHSDGSTFSDGSQYSQGDGADQVAAKPPEPIRVNSAAWTGLTAVRINARNAAIVGGLIDKALSSLPQRPESNFESMQAVAYLRAAKELVNAPEPPSELIWSLISKAADVLGIVGLFYTIFSQVAH